MRRGQPIGTTGRPVTAAGIRGCASFQLRPPRPASPAIVTTPPEAINPPGSRARKRHLAAPAELVQTRLVTSSFQCLDSIRGGLQAVLSRFALSDALQRAEAAQRREPPLLLPSCGR